MPMTTIKSENGIETVDNCGGIQLRCCECGRWVRTSVERIRHAKSCESQAQPACEAQAVTPNRDDYVRAVARQGAVSAVCDEDEILARVRCGLLSVSDAMNRDF